MRVVVAVAYWLAVVLTAAGAAAIAYRIYLRFLLQANVSAHRLWIELAIAAMILPMLVAGKLRDSPRVYSLAFRVSIALLALHVFERLLISKEAWEFASPRNIATAAIGVLVVSTYLLSRFEVERTAVKHAPK